MKTWHTYMRELAQHIATKSKDPSRQVGCVIIGPDKEIRSTGFNGFPRGVQETVEGSEHLPDEFVSSADGRHYQVSCTCGEVIKLKTTELNTNIHGVYPTMESYTQIVDDMCKAHEHFKPQERVLSDRWERPQKYQWVEHAERNAIYNAARSGIALKGCTAYVTLAPCAGCTRAIIQAGITTVYGPEFPEGIEYTEYGFDKSIIMLDEARVRYYTYEGLDNA